MQIQSETFIESASEALADQEKVQRRDLMALFTPLMRDAAMDSFGKFEEQRAHLHRIRQHTLEHLDHYLERFEQEAVDNGNQVHYAVDGEAMNSIVLEICQRHGARQVAKGKSMVTEETGLSHHLESAGLQVMETDLGEYIIQQAGETPSHIVGPALHKSRQEIGELFRQKHDLGERELEARSLVAARSARGRHE